MQIFFVILWIFFFTSCSKNGVNNHSNFYLNENDITCMCPNSKVGEKGIIKGVEYESVDITLLRKRIEEGADLTKVCTSLVTSMVNLFEGNRSFNQPIGHWDVSNVEDMTFMFVASTFNQPIEKWDVRKVTKMSGMFERSPFNQNIGAWNVFNVTNMDRMFADSPFSQDISKWCVSKIPNEPQNFATNTPMTSIKKPKWGSCQF
jgi:hypothetical protein